ncbi:MAG: hypothetical protein ACK41T_07165, partial [Pseudobdellovibrio sp.]
MLFQKIILFSVLFLSITSHAVVSQVHLDSDKSLSKQMLSLTGLSSATIVQKNECSSIRIAGTEIICLLNGVGTFSAHERANDINEKLEWLVKNPQFDLTLLHLMNLEHYVNIIADDKIIVSISDADIDRTLADTRQQMANIIIDRIQKSIPIAREQRSPIALLRGFAYSLVATLVLGM